MNNFLKGVQLHQFNNKIMELILCGKNDFALEFVKTELNFDSYSDAKNYIDGVNKTYFKVNKI